MKFTRRHLQIVAGVTVVLALAAWLWPSNAQPTNQDKQTMQTFIQPMTTRCVGRFMIDVPAKAVDVRGQYGFQIAKVMPVQRTSGPTAETLRRLDRELAGRRDTERGRKDAYGDPILDTKVYEPTVHVRSLRYEEPVAASKPRMRGYVVRSSGTFLLETSAIAEERIQEFNDFLIELEPTLSVRENSVIPTTPGFCIDDGFIAMNPKKGESATMAWDLAGHPDVRFSLFTQSNDDKVRTGHLDREGETIAHMGNLMSSIKTLRKRRFELVGMPAQEWSVEFTDTPKLELRIEIPGAPNDKARPFIAMTMQVGGAETQAKPSLSTGEALALWDAVIQTLRLRPGAD